MKTIAVKVVVLGSQGVGKTSLVTRYETKSFHRKSSSTIGASFSNVDILLEGTKVKMQVWDTAGQERFRSMAPMYYRGANAALLIFDLSNYVTFTDIQSWVSGVQEMFNIVAVEMFKRADKEENSSLRVYSPDGKNQRNENTSNVKLSEIPVLEERNKCC
ncbi:Ras-like GTP-binding protein RYL2-like [Homarus americanus]|uniref:Ras-like GTP-binding protein RYL2-like n=1 Tax=Homarus americanus TaxID=6706 RepID=A0A8J5N681_HOMAM|nr:Ras-like GTP-binding protein RYL2-like [Homarus americanus]